MRAASKSFPWRVFARLAALQAYLVIAAFMISGLAARHLFLMILAGGALWASAVVWSRGLVGPLGGLISKARDGAPGLSPSEQLEGEEPGEWVELESALDRIQSDLKQKTDTLSREREELAILMAAISDAILAVDRVGKPLFFNSRFARLFFDKDTRDREPRLGELFRAPEILRVFRDALEQGDSQEASLQLYVRSDPAPRYFAISVAPLKHEVGPPYGAVGIFHDVTELKRAESIRIEFVANVSHELRTPLTAIKGYADTLKEDVRQQRYESAGRFLEIITRNVDRLMSLIGDLLELSSLESPREAEDSAGGLAKAALETREVTARVLAQLESRRADKRHRIEARFDAASIDADPALLEQVLANLLENAIKYVPEGGKIDVMWEKSGPPEGERTVLLHVSDNGPGIAPEHLPRLFERFYRVDQARSRELGGTGLGLAIVKHIVQRHGGTVGVTSEAGKGTTFTCRFPGRTVGSSEG